MRRKRERYVALLPPATSCRAEAYATHNTHPQNRAQRKEVSAAAFMQEDKSLTFLDLIAQRIQTGELRERVASFGSESHKAHELKFFVLLQTLRKAENEEEKNRRDSLTSLSGTSLVRPIQQGQRSCVRGFGGTSKQAC